MQNLGAIHGVLDRFWSNFWCRLFSVRLGRFSARCVLAPESRQRVDASQNRWVLNRSSAGSLPGVSFSEPSGEASSRAPAPCTTSFRSLFFCRVCSFPFSSVLAVVVHQVLIEATGPISGHHQQAGSASQWGCMSSSRPPALSIP